MAEANKPFVVTDRRKFTMDGEVRPDAERQPEPEPEVQHAAAAPVASVAGPQEVSTPEVREAALPEAESFDDQQDLPPAPSEEQMARAKAAYEQTTDRLDTAIRATNPGGDHPQTMDFVQMVQSFYMTAILQLGGTTQEGQQPQIDLLGARQSIDMLAVLTEKTKGSLSPEETRLLESALFDARMAFLEVTQAIARQAQQAAAAKGTPGPGGFAGPGGGMGLVR